MSKIYVDKNDSVASIVEKVIDSKDDVVLYIPRFTKISASINNFRVLKREIDASGKLVEIESVDDDVLDMAKTAGLKAVNPFFNKNNRRAVSDIVMPSEPIPGVKEHSSGKHPVHHHESGHIHVEDEVPPPPVKHPRQRRALALPPFSFKKAGVAVLALMLLAGVGYAAATVLPKADVRVVLDRIDWTFNGTLSSSAALKEGKFADGQAKVPGVIFEKSKNMSQSFPASGTQAVERKAVGKITIYNAYSSSPQTLVKDTRFASPDGKVFRITKYLVIPGAKIVDNKIVSSSIEVDVVADQAGDSYNIAPAKFRIPGFEGTPKYDGFYGESSAPMAGGLVGTIKIATATDIANAKTVISKSIESAMRAEIALTAPKDIKIIDNSSRFIITKIDVEKDGDAGGNFSVTAFGNIKTFGFRESDVFQVLESKLIDEIKADMVRKGTLDTSKATNGNIDLILKDGYTVQYGEPRIDFEAKTMSASLNFRSTWVRTLDVDKLESDIAGKKQKELASGPLPAPGIKSMSIKLWPFWVKTIPADKAKITIDVQ